MRFLFVNALSELPGIWKSILRVSYRLGLPSLDSYRLRSHNSALHHHTEDAHIHCKSRRPNATVAEASSVLSLRQNLLRGYEPCIIPNNLGREGHAAMVLDPEQKICYYPDKLHGGYLAFLMDEHFANCCPSAVTAWFNMDFLKSINPNVTRLALRAWPVKINGRKIYMEGSITIPDESTGKELLAARASALFVIPRE